ncbi:MAG: hypothetical protein H0U13_05070, partial [Gemmatimonadaceae bacterium]|nr:hypothetical protein [Gemmatimonadaceae bacterium]
MTMRDTVVAHRRPIRSRRWFWPFTILALISNAVLALAAAEVITMSEPVRVALAPAYVVRLAVSIPFIAIARLFDTGPGYWPFQLMSFLSIAPFVLIDVLVRRVRRARPGAAALLTLVVLCTSMTACAARNAVPDRSANEWPAYGRDALGSRFSPLSDINRDNVGRLTVAWTYHTGEPLPTAQRKRSLEVTPIVVNGVMYISTPLGKVMALDPVTGAEKWKFDAHVDASTRFGDFTNRGVS